MKQANRNVIGEGAFGCVHKPSLKCQTPPSQGFNYNNYVSKIMTKTNAQKELAEFVIISNIDPTNKYHLGTPKICSPNVTQDNFSQDISKCKNIKNTDVMRDPNKYGLLLLKFGGINLKELVDKYFTKYLSKDKDNRVDLFFIEIHRLIMGLKMFKDNGIIHYDIKPQNILFSPETGEMKYIDFGQMRTKRVVINSSTNNNNGLGSFHWSYPFDCGIMNKNQYDKFKRLDEDERDDYTFELNGLIDRGIINNHNYKFKLPIKKPTAFLLLFNYINLVPPFASARFSYVDEFVTGMGELVDTKSYPEVLDFIADSIDVFGLGFTLQYMINNFKKVNAISVETYTIMSSLFNKMCDFNPRLRLIDIDLILTEYETILLQIGVLTRLNMRFENHIIENGTPVPSAVLKEEQKEEQTQPKSSSKELEQLAYQDAVEISVRCPQNTEFNHATGCCVKKCDPGYQRDANFNCKKQPKTKIKKQTKKRSTSSSSSKSIKGCPPDKELNPKTNRCVKKCAPEYYRDADFKCKKTRRLKSSSSLNTPPVKRCPIDKELNPKTNRCINKCNPGYHRDADFKCKKNKTT
jgi:serine/threonine protein kinase